MNKIRKGDQVIVIAGKDKGARGQVKSVENNKALIDGVNTVKKHVKPNPQKGVEGGIQTKSMPIELSNIALINPGTQKGDRVGIKSLEDGRKVRFFKSNNELVDV